MSYTPSTQDQWAINAVNNASEYAFRVWAAILPVRVPKVYDITDGDVGRGHDPSFDTIVRMGPDRMGFVGQPIIFYANDSYARSGALPSPPGQSWEVREYGGTTDEDYLTHRGSNLTPGTTGDSFTWTPSTAGLYVVELHMNGGFTGAEEPAGYGRRFVRIFDDEDSVDANLLEVLTMSHSGGLDQLGHALTVTCRLNDEIKEKYEGVSSTIQDNQRVVIFYKLYYKTVDERVDGGGNPIDPLTYGQLTWLDFTWNPGRGSVASQYYAPNIYFSGIVRGSSVSESIENNTISFTIQTSQSILEQMNLPVVQKNIPEIDERFPANVTTTFLESSVYTELIAKDPVASDFLWIHHVQGMQFSDVLRHIIHRHTDFAVYNDFFVGTLENDDIVALGTQGDNILTWIKSVADRRMSVLWADRKGNFYIGPHLNMRKDDHWSTSSNNQDFTMLDKVIGQISASSSTADVGQVIATSVDQKEILRAELRGRGMSTVQSFLRHVYRAVYPEKNPGGKVLTVRSVLAFSNQRLADMAAAYRKHNNATWKNVSTVHTMLPQLDLNQVVAIQHETFTGDTRFNWSAGKLFIITGSRDDVDVQANTWISSYTYYEVTSAYALEIPKEPPVASIHAVPSVEVLQDRQVRMIQSYDWTALGDGSLSLRTWSDGLGNTSHDKNPVWVYDETVDQVTLTLTVTDSYGAVSTATKAVDFTAIPANNPVATGETIWAASDVGMYVSPDGGLNWYEPPNTGAANATWAADDSSIGYAGCQDGSVWYTLDRGLNWTQGTGHGNSPVMPHAMWGLLNPSSVFYGCQDGTLWEANYQSGNSSFVAAQITRFTDQTRNTSPVTYVQVVKGLIVVGAGEYLYAGRRGYWTRLHHFPHDIKSGSSESGVSPIGDEDGAYSFMMSLVFDDGSWELGRVEVRDAGLTWVRFNVSPAPSSSGTDVSISPYAGASGGVLATFESETKSYILSNPTDSLPGPGKAVPSVPEASSGYAITFGPKGRNVAFLGHTTGIHKNLDPLAGA